MERIKTATRIPNKHGPGRDGFGDGNPTTGTPSTQLEADWFDASQEEIARVIELTGEPLAPGDFDQLYRAINRMIGGAGGEFVRKIGDTMTGPLTIAYNNEVFVAANSLNNDAAFVGFQNNGIGRWTVGKVANGDDFVIQRFTAGGGPLDFPVQIAFGTGDILTRFPIYVSQERAPTATPQIAWHVGGGQTAYLCAAGQANQSVLVGIPGAPNHDQGNILRLSSLGGWYTGPQEFLQCGEAGDRRCGMTGNGTVYGTGPFFDLTSFTAMKSSIAQIDDPIALIRRLRPVQYYHEILGRQQHGFLIEDLVTDFPEAVGFNQAGEPDGYYPTMMIAGIVAAFQIMQARLETLEARIAGSS